MWQVRIHLWMTHVFHYVVRLGLHSEYSNPLTGQTVGWRPKLLKTVQVHSEKWIRFTP